jgi:type IV secretion system protein TrbL
MPTAGILTTLLKAFCSALTPGLSSLSADASALLRILVGLELAIAGIWWAFSHEDAVVGFLKRVLVIGCFAYLVLNFSTLVNTVIKGFIYAGLKGGGNAVSEQTFADPSAIAELGLKITQPIWESVKERGIYGNMTNIGALLASVISAFLILLAFFFLGIQIFVTYLEFYLVSLVCLILLPFGVFRPTAFIAERTFGAVIGFGVKFMILAIIVSVVQPLVSTWTLPADPEFDQCMILALGALAIAALAWHAPSVAGGMLAGSPSLTAGTAVGATMALGAGAYYGGQVFSRTTAGIASAGRTGASATRAAVNYLNK